jgi:hypothetical protein
MRCFLFVTLFAINSVFAAVGCNLNDPDRNIKKLFPESTSYGTTFKTIKDISKVEELLEDKFSGLYETVDVPYTIYTIYNDKKVIGYVHGINQKGKYGGLQVFLVYDTKGKILNLYYQKLTNKDEKAKYMKTKEFADQFKSLSFKDFSDYDPLEHTGIPKSIKDLKIGDFYATLRAVKKNLILMDIFIFKVK